MRKQSKAPPSFAALVQAYFAEYLTQQRALSAQTIAAYRDAFVLFLLLCRVTPEQVTGRDGDDRHHAGIDHDLPRSSGTPAT